MNTFDTLKRRGLVAQTTDEQAVRELIDGPPCTVYAGFDPTADSLHVGNLVPILGLARLQKAGHRIIAVCGGATALIGDPSGKTSLRPMIDRERLKSHLAGIRPQLERFLILDGERGILLDNADWISPLGWLEALRMLGPRFSVSRMLSYETYKTRLETGLTFLELSYQLLQAYDFLHLWREQGCTLQIGGDDQWANILAGMDLIRRVESASVEGLTLPLLTTATGHKMGKTEDGALWLDPARTSPYNFYQYWINIDDADVHKCLCFFTDCTIEEIEHLTGSEGPGIVETKRLLAKEFTTRVHGSDEAEKAQTAARAAFGGGGAGVEGVPSSTIQREELQQGIELLGLLVQVGICKSKGDARRLVKQGGAYVNGTRIDDIAAEVSESDLEEDAIMLRGGKKRFHRVIVA